MAVKLCEIRSDHYEAFRQLYASTLEWMTVSAAFTASDIDAALLDSNSVWRMCESTAGLVGLAGFHTINPIDRSADPLVAISPGKYRQGLGLQMGHELARFGFDTLNLQRLHTRVLPDAPSRRLLEKMGFKHEATFEKARYRNGEYVDVLAYRLFKEEYKQCLQQQ